MPKTDNFAPHLRPFVALGVDLTRSDGPETSGACPFCDSSKFYVKADTGQWDCKRCGLNGNLYTFLRTLWEVSLKSTKDYSWLESDRNLPGSALREFGVCKSALDGVWVCPQYGVGGTITNLARYKTDYGTGKYRLMPTPPSDVLPQGYYRQTEAGADYTDLDISESVWDMVAWKAELLRADRAKHDRTLFVATPGANVWSDSWAKLCSGRVVTVYTQNDHPRTNPATGHVNQASFDGTKRVVKSIRESGTTVESVSYLEWSGRGGDEAKGFDPTLKSGYDLRDAVSERNGEAVGWVRSLIRPAPSVWTADAVVRNEGLRASKCTSWSDLLGAWKVAFPEYGEDFENALIYCLSIATSVEYGENRLWGKLIGVAGSGKSTIVDSIAIADRYTVSEATINDFYSGFDPGGDGKDRSFAARLRNMCWINTDADTLLKNTNRAKILGQMRELYTGQGGKQFGNDVGARAYKDLHFTVLFAGTPSIRELDGSEFGSRFVDYHMDRPSAERIRAITKNAIRNQTSGIRTGSGLPPNVEYARRMTGGYTEYLRRTSPSFSSKVSLTDAQVDRIQLLADYVGHMRSRASKTQDEDDDTVEIPTRVGSQLATLAIYSAVIRNRPTVDVGAMNLVRKVALDTARGRTRVITDALAKAGSKGLDLNGIVAATKRDHDTDHNYVAFMTRAGILEMFHDGPLRATARARWRLTDKFSTVYYSVFPKGSN